MASIRIFGFETNLLPYICSILSKSRCPDSGVLFAPGSTSLSLLEPDTNTKKWSLIHGGAVGTRWETAESGKVISVEGHI